jgi:hypothetical protein
LEETISDEIIIGAAEMPDSPYRPCKHPVCLMPREMWPCQTISTIIRLSIGAGVREYCGVPDTYRLVHSGPKQ